MKRKQKKKLENGYTMVEIIVSFSILMMLGVMFSNIFLFAGRMTRDTVQTLERYEAFAEDYYLQKDVNRALAAEGELLFLQQGEEGREGRGQFVITGVRLYRNTSREGGAGQIYDVEGSWAED